jgi:glycerol 3-phosphatase-2
MPIPWRGGTSLVGDPGVSAPRRLRASGAPLAQVHDVGLLDLDGVVYIGPDAVPHAAQALDEASRRFGMRPAFVTNNAARPPQVVAEHLVALGIRATAEDVVTSAQAGARMLARLVPVGARVLAVGGPGVAWALDERGLVAVSSADDDPDAVMQGYGPEVGWRELAEASLVIDRGRPWVATNLDRTIPSLRGRVLGNGSLVAALRHATGAEPLVAGKPEPPLMEESILRTGAHRPVVVGDRLDTDIEGATRSGIPALLVLTGVTDWPELVAASPARRPTYLGADLRALLRPAPEIAVTSGAGWIEARCRGAVARVRVGPQGDLPEPRPGRGDAPWWLPERLLGQVPGGGDDPTENDAHLDIVRALVAVGWAAADSGTPVQEQAVVGADG